MNGLPGRAIADLLFDGGIATRNGSTAPRVELFSNCRHGSEIAVYSITDGSKKVIRKSASTASGVADLAREAAGWAWYQSRRYPRRESPIYQWLARGVYCRIDVDWIEGRKHDYQAGLLPNDEIIRLALEQYCCLWPNADLVPLHGDFSVDNFILNDDGLHVIDWEHFHQSGGPWGFDALYLLYESLWFSTESRRLPNRQEIRALTAGLRRLGKVGRMSDAFARKPLQTLRAFIHEHRDIWGEQLRRFPEKLLVVKFSNRQAADIDRMVGRASPYQA